jgi:hypothetical protein
VKPRIIKLVATNPFRGLEDDNPYRHIKEFTMICNTVQQEGVPASWFKWNLFPFSLEDEARRWYTFTSVKAKGNWDESEEVSFEVISHKQGPRLKEVSAHFQARRG